MSENYLAHYGILGQKWGVRRFQPYSVRGRKSGEGGKEIGDAAKAAKRVDRDALFAQTIKGGKDKPNVSPAEKIIGESGKIVDNTGNLVRMGKKIKSRNSVRESKTLSDDELHRRIKRLELEKRYEDLTDEDIRRGKITANDILDSVGSVIAIGGSLATIYAVSRVITKG